MEAQKNCPVLIKMAISILLHRNYLEVSLGLPWLGWK